MIASPRKDSIEKSFGFSFLKRKYYQRQKDKKTKKQKNKNIKDKNHKNTKTRTGRTLYICTLIASPRKDSIKKTFRFSLLRRKYYHFDLMIQDNQKLIVFILFYTFLYAHKRLYPSLPFLYIASSDDM